MKKVNLFLLLMLIFPLFIFAQRGKWQDEETKEKFEQLEKIKLIETLQMDEETTLRFFARRTEHRSKQEEIQGKIQEKIEHLDALFISGRVATVEEIKSVINEIGTLETQLVKNRTDYISSLSDILSYEQIAKLIVFEKRFRNEIKKLIIKERKPPKDPR
jgi:hypothetical protein